MKHLRAVTRTVTYYQPDTSFLTAIFSFVLDILMVTGKDKSPNRRDHDEKDAW
jgi:hypothetical protein